jgi:putative oxidoreductase
MVMSRLCEMVKHYSPLAGRILMAAIFVMSGWGKITGFAATAAYMASKGMLFPELLLAGAIAVELVGGILLIFGWQTRWAALAIFLFLIPTTLVFHNFWAVDAAQVQAQTIQFMKNLAIMGGMLYVMAFGAGPLSLDNRRR